MKDAARIGTIGQERFVVSAQHLIDFAHDGMPQILCTPWLLHNSKAYKDGLEL
jgi:hypothetical protein